MRFVSVLFNCYGLKIKLINDYEFWFFNPVGFISIPNLFYNFYFMIVYFRNILFVVIILANISFSVI